MARFAAFTILCFVDAHQVGSPRFPQQEEAGLLQPDQARPLRRPGIASAYVDSQGSSLLEQDGAAGDLGGEGYQTAEVAQDADSAEASKLQASDISNLLLSGLAELEDDVDLKIHKGSGDLGADSVVRINEEESRSSEVRFWSYVNLGAETGRSEEAMRPSSIHLSTLGDITSAVGSTRSYKVAAAIVGLSDGKAAEWSNLALAGTAFIGIFRNASEASPARWKIYSAQPAQASITTMRSQQAEGEIFTRGQIQTFTSLQNDVVQLTSSGDVVVQSMEGESDFVQLAPVDEAVYGVCNEYCAVMAFDCEAEVLVEECVDGTQKTYDKSAMVEETYWLISTMGKVCRWSTTGGAKIAGTSHSDTPGSKASMTLLPSTYFQDLTLFPVALTHVQIIGTQATTCEAAGQKFALTGSGSVYSAELDEVAAKSALFCKTPVMVFGMAGVGDTVQLLNSPSTSSVAYTKYANGVCDTEDKFDKDALEEEHPVLPDGKVLEWKLITTKEKPGVCNVDSLDECFSLCSSVKDCKFFATHFAANCKACLLFKSCQSSGSTSLVQDDGEGEAHGSSQGGTEFERYDIFQVEQSDGKDLASDSNLIKNPMFTDGKTGWTELCPPMMYNGKNLSFECKNSGVWNSVPEVLGGDKFAYQVTGPTGSCWQGSRGGVYQDLATEMGFTYELTYKLIDGYFDKKDSKVEKSWVEVQSPVGHPVLDEEASTSNSAKEPIKGQWQTKGPYTFIAAGNKSRIFFYTGGTACTSIDDVIVRKTKDPKYVVYNFAHLINDGHFMVTKGAFPKNASDNSSDGSSLQVLKDNVVIMKPSEKAGDQREASHGENDLDVNTLRLTGGGCSRVSGFVRYTPKPLYKYDDKELMNGSVLSSVTFEVQEPIGNPVNPPVNVGVTGAVINAVLDPSPEHLRIRVRKEASVKSNDTDNVIEAQLYFFCKGGDRMSYRSGWKLFTYQFAGNEGLCLSMGARDSMGMGCHEVSCRKNPISDASLQPCNEEDWAQNFYPEGPLVRSASPAERCLAVDYSAHVEPCKPITLKMCDESDPGQRWSIVGGDSAQDAALLKMEDGLVVSTPKAKTQLASFDMLIQACDEKEVAAVKQWNQIPSPTVASLVMAHELSTNFTQKASGSGELLLSDVWAEAVCPWFFNPPLHTDSKFLKCYNSDLCDPDEDGEDCCATRKGTFMCSSSAPYMCKSKTNGKAPSDYFCVKDNADCEEYDGRRPCEGPPGDEGSVGEPGEDGLPGEDGRTGDPGVVKEAAPPSLSREGAKAFLAQGASPAELAGAVALNCLLSLIAFGSLRGKIKDRMDGKAGSVAPQRA